MSDRICYCSGACIALWREKSLGEDAMRGLHRVISRPGIVALPKEQQSEEGEPVPSHLQAPWSFTMQDFTECAELSDLPHHPSDAATVEGLLRATESIVKECGDPAFVTIARSVEDGYTPPAQAEALEGAILDILKHSLPRQPKVKQR